MNSKRGQFFILAAVLIASVVFSLSVAKNLLDGPDKPDDFYVLSEQLDNEVNAVLNSDFISGDNKTSEFIDEYVEYINKSKIPTEIVFMYFQNGSLIVKNYAKSQIEISGFSSCSTSCSVDIGLSLGYPINTNEAVNLSMAGQVFNYNLSKGSKSYIVIMRNVSREVYIDVKE